MSPKKKKSNKNKSSGSASSRPQNNGDGGPSVLNGCPVTDPLGCSFLSLQREAVRRGLFELQQMLSELIDGIETNNRKRLLGILALVQGESRLQESLSPKQLRRALKALYDSLKEAFKVFRDPQFAQAASNNDERAIRLLKLLSPKGKFDMAHECSQIQRKVKEATSGSRADAESDRKVREFEMGQPVDKYQRSEEPGFADAREKAELLTSAEEANELGKKAWSEDYKWQAELYWSRATELDGSEAKYWSNLAFIRIQLGRYLRSQGIGYRRFADQLLEAAVSDAAKGVEMDAKWERAYQRGAEAHLALGPYDHAMDACRILTKAMKEIEEPSDDLLRLHQIAKANASLWCTLGIPPGRATIPVLAGAALRNLRRSVVQSLPVDALSDDEIRKRGDHIARQASVVGAVLQLLYLRRNQWRRDSKAANMDATDIEVQLRHSAKVVPLKAVCLSESLKHLVFMEEPHTLWGLDRLDRKGAESLPFDAVDPCCSDATVGADEALAHEMFQRKTGESPTRLSQMASDKEMRNGKEPESFERDFAPHHFCSFSISVLQRLVMDDSPLRESAVQRVIDLALCSNGHALWAGGQFLGMAINVATGIGKFGLPENATRTAEFMRTVGGIAVMAIEISNSGDSHFFLQDAMTQLSPDDWKSTSRYDIFVVLRRYLLPGMDGDALNLKIEKISPYFATILSSLLDGHPDMLDFFRGRRQGSSVGRFLPLFGSCFGIFLMRQYLRYEQSLIDKDLPSSTKDVLAYMVEKWVKLSKNKRSAYRWEALDSTTKEKLSEIAPVSKVDLINARKEGKQASGSVKKKDPIVKKLPHCAKCGKKEGFGLELLHCPCRVVMYCSAECQKLGWPEHEKLCREIRSSR